VAQQAREGDAAGAHAGDVRIVGAANGARHLEGFPAGGDVGVEAPVPLRSGGVAPADGEVRNARRDRVFDEASAGSDVADVVLVDLRWDHNQRTCKRLRPCRLVLDELEHLSPVDDLARSHGEIHT
jgi:hypothetical protein